MSTPKSSCAELVRHSSSLAILAAIIALSLPAVAGAQGAVFLNVVSGRDEPRAFGGAGVVKGQPVGTFKYIINVDNTGLTAGSFADTPACRPDGDPAYPANCPWPSIRAVPGSSPIATQGDQNDFPPGTGVTLPNGRYLISILADGYKLDGKHFTVPDDPFVTVELQPHPLPTATIQAVVFEDTSPTNGAPDVPAERGLAGFQGHIVDYIDFVTTDVFGNPLCTEYERDPITGEVILNPPDYSPTAIAGTGGQCLSKCYDAAGAVVPPTDAAGHCPVGAMGILKIPNLGPNRYGASAVPPDGTGWVQTTTLEGFLEWDSWVMEGATGLDTEFVQAAEPFPWTMFGFVPPTPMSVPGGTGSISGVVVSAKVYIPTAGGTPTPGTIWGSTSGARPDKPVPNPWISLTSLTGGDTAIYVGQGAADGTFDIPNVPAGNYMLTYWDSNLRNILDLVNVSVGPGEQVDMGWLPLTGWFTTIEGHVFNDLNRNGKRDTGEPGLAGFPVVLKKRENSIMDRGAKVVTTDAAGYYVMENAYPLTQWIVVEAYSDLYYTTGVTFQTDNQPTETTLLGAGVDVNVLPIIGLGGRLDWGVHAYDATGRTRGLDPRNGGIVGTVSYDTTRNELDPRYAAVEDWQPGIPDMTVDVYAPVPCTAGVPCDASGRYRLAPDGSYLKGKLLNSAVTETWARPRDCVARDLNGNPLTTPLTLPPSTGGHECLEAPLMGVQFENGYAAVDGNYGFTDGCFGAGGFDPVGGACADGQPPTALPAGDYLVEVTSPNDTFGRPLFQVTREEDINIFNGDQWVPQIPPPACAGPLHTVDVANVGVDGYPAIVMPNGVTVPASVPSPNQPFADGGGSPFEGMPKPLCNAKLVRVSNGRSIAPTFNYFTEVPLPGRLVTYMIDDLSFSSDPTTTFFGEKAGAPHMPVGIYDYANRHVVTTHTDWNGVFDVLLPSTNRINCPTPSGVCANLFRLVGNDPGIPGRLNPDYNPQYRTISAIFEVLPGLLVPADLAPTQVGVTVQLPGGQFSQPVACPVTAGTPQLLTVSTPFGPLGTTFTLTGVDFGALQGRGRVLLDGTPLTISAWTDTEITATVPASAIPGPRQLRIFADNGRSTVNGLTWHVMGGAYNPDVYEVGPGRTYAGIQLAIEAAAGTGRPSLVVVHPATPIPFVNPMGAYFENVVIHAPVKLQGVGPGGFLGATWIPGSIVDGGAYAGDNAHIDAWRALVASLNFDGNQQLFEGATVSVFTQNNAFDATFRTAIDGFMVRGGNQEGFPANIDQIGGGATGLPPNVVVQGGGIFANAYARWLTITNNVITNNGGAYAGAVRLGTPNLPAPNTSSENQFVRIASNRIVANGGTNLAGAIGIFAGSDGYEVAGNDICGNFSAEYGGGISVYGYSPGGSIHDNRIYLNRSYDEGGGVMIAGELPAVPGTLSPGTGPVDVYANVIQANLANDDGGGLRFLMAGNYPMNVYDNFIVNNVSTHEGGGIGINDSPSVRVFANTIMKNMTTASAVTSNGLPAPAGLSTSLNSAALQATLPPGAPPFSEPLLFDNVFWDNRAGTRAGGTVVGLGQPGDASPIQRWDLGTADGSGLLRPTFSILQTTNGTEVSPSNRMVDPAVVATYDVGLSFQPWRTNPTFVDAILVTFDLPPDQMGNYHLSSGSPAVDGGTGSKGGVFAPAMDIDGDVRLGLVDIGADELASAVGTLDFPTTGLIDLFNRNDGPLGANWTGDTATGTYRVFQAQAQGRATGSVYWNAATFGAGQEAWVTLMRVLTGSGGQGLILKFTGTSLTSADAALIDVVFRAGTGTVQVRTLAPGQGYVVRANFPASLVAGDQLGVRALPSGVVTVFRNGAVVGAVDLSAGANPWPSANRLGGGRLGIRNFGATRGNDVRLDNFGGGTMP